MILNSTRFDHGGLSIVRCYCWFNYRLEINFENIILYTQTFRTSFDVSNLTFQNLCIIEKLANINIIFFNFHPSYLNKFSIT